MYRNIAIVGTGYVGLSIANMRVCWNIAAECLDEKYPIIFLTSFNEWHEETEVEPSEEYGDKYPNMTAKEKMRF